ncbi:MAG: CopG family transcriptional regulator [Bacteroidetes bacterium]|nr:MAG: CopG family transcriptional regulator [Bacteroidota bacterium]RLD48666.1 MAG: CopG family transcriptional regulator [Bacteroidota bacterium]RLD88142.1 MAG: CopG family transcriptional regulator [Bacteroidota bacterium]
MATFTSTLPDSILQQLQEQAKKMSVPKNKIIERALKIYLDQLNRAEYVTSYQQAAQDTDIMNIAEEGMEDYLKQLSE